MLVCAALLLVDCGGGANNKAPDKIIKLDPPPKQQEAPKPDPRWKYQDSLDKAVRWVLDNQKPDHDTPEFKRKGGDWGYMSERPYDIYLGSINSLHVWGNTSTALCLMGLLEVEPTDEINTALRRGYEYLIDAPDTPRASQNTFYNVWSHTYMVQALLRGAKDERFKELAPNLRRRAEHELKRLMDHQAIDGGWGYYDFQNHPARPTGDYSTPFNTAAALVALHEAFQAGLRARKLVKEGEDEIEGEGLRDHNVKIALDYVQRHRIPNGAYYYSSGHMYYPQGQASLPRGSLGRSQSGDNALYTWGREVVTQDVLKQQLDVFFKDHIFIEIGRGRQFPHEAWYATAPYYYYFGHYYASRNVLALKEDIRAEYADKLADLVVKGQYDDGSYWDYPLYGYHKPYGTGYALMILNNCKKAMEGKP
jgi:hypothetical protein